MMPNLIDDTRYDMDMARKEGRLTAENREPSCERLFALSGSSLTVSEHLAQKRAAVEAILTLQANKRPKHSARIAHTMHKTSLSVGSDLSLSQASCIDDLEQRKPPL